MSPTSYQTAPSRGRHSSYLQVYVNLNFRFISFLFICLGFKAKLWMLESGCSSIVVAAFAATCAVASLPEGLGEI
jgi:hypothetical protein